MLIGLHIYEVMGANHQPVVACHMVAMAPQVLFLGKNSGPLPGNLAGVAGSPLKQVWTPTDESVLHTAWKCQACSAKVQVSSAVNPVMMHEHIIGTVSLRNVPLVGGALFAKPISRSCAAFSEAQKRWPCAARRWCESEHHLRIRSFSQGCTASLNARR